MSPFHHNVFVPNGASSEGDGDSEEKHESSCSRIRSFDSLRWLEYGSEDEEMRWLIRCVEAAGKGFVIGTGLKGGLALFSILARLRSRRSRKEGMLTNKDAMVIGVKETLRYGLFLGTFAGMFVSVDECIAAIGGHKRTAKWRYLLAGLVAGPSMLLTGSDTQHTSLALYILMRASVLASRCGIKSKRFGPVCKPMTWSHGDLFLMCLSSSQILSSYILKQDSLPSTYKSFLNKHGGKDSVILEGVKSIACGIPFTNLEAIESYYKSKGLEGDSDSEMDMDEDSEDFDEESLPVQPIPNPRVEEDEFPSSSTDDENRTQNPSPNPNNNHDVVFADPPLNQEPQTQHQNLPSLLPVTSTSSSRNGVRAATSMQPPPPGSVAPPVLDETVETPEAKRPKLDGTIVVSEERKSASSVLEDSRRLFQRLWTDEDEIAILQGFYEFTSQRGTTHHAHQHDTGPFYDQIRTKLQLDFNKNQLVEKLRRLKKKYRNVVNRMNSGKEFVFKSPHDQATFEISKKIWSNSIISRTGNYDQDEDDDANDGYHNETGGRVRKRGKKQTHPDASATATESEPVAVEVKVVPTLTTLCPPVAPAASTSLAPLFPNVVEETVRNCISPFFKEILNFGMGGSMAAGLGGGTPPLAMGMMPLSLMGNPGNLIASASKDGEVGEKWRKQQILELKMYSKRLELVQEQINATLSELQSDHK